VRFRRWQSSLLRCQPPRVFDLLCPAQANAQMNRTNSFYIVDPLSITIGAHVHLQLCSPVILPSQATICQGCLLSNVQLKYATTQMQT
jgi:hypothetical protein